MVEIREAEVHWFEEGCFDYGLEGFDSDGAVGLAQTLSAGLVSIYSTVALGI